MHSCLGAAVPWLHVSYIVTNQRGRLLLRWPQMLNGVASPCYVNRGTQRKPSHQPLPTIPMTVVLGLRFSQKTAVRHAVSKKFLDMGPLLKSPRNPPSRQGRRRLPARVLFLSSAQSSFTLSLGISPTFIFFVSSVFHKLIMHMITLHAVPVVFRG